MKKQVEASHYGFGTYVSKKRWASMWHQLDEVLSLKPETVLELGPGPGIFKALAKAFGVTVETVDIDPELKPDHRASILEMPFADNSYDLVCAFQMLEHLPYTNSLKAFSEMARVAKKHVVISLPDAQRVWRFWFHIPYLGDYHWHLPLMPGVRKKHLFKGEHYWEINKRGYALKKVLADFSESASISKKIKLLHTYRVTELPYHRFFVFAVTIQGN